MKNRLRRVIRGVIEEVDMPKWISGPDGERAWKKAKGIVANEYGRGLEKSAPEKFYSLVATIYKNVCKSSDYDCGIGEGKEMSMKELIERASKRSDSEAMADLIMQGLKKHGIKRVTKSLDELYIESGDDEASIHFDSKGGRAFIRVVINDESKADAKAIAAILKKHGM